ncbi:MAG: hypothetical protein PHZ09_00800 [Eubacteriales bacterium]|nr:hypothetical protein [Eubacteriales bacterium]
MIIIRDRFTDMPHGRAAIDFAENTGQLCFSRHSYGIGGVNSMPMPDSVVRGMRELNPGLIRIFIQEFFDIAGGNEPDFGRLDAYIKAIHDTGAEIFASICIKPKSLFPVIDENIWMPSDIQKWKEIIAAMVTRYSVENRYVTYWGIGNEINIGEYGGCPYKITDVNDYFEYYKMTAGAVLGACPGVKVGGPSFAGVNGETYEFFDRFIPLCLNNGIRLDFISYNIYSDEISHHIGGARAVRDIAAKYDRDIEIYVTEMNIGIGGEVSVEEKAYDARRAAALAAIVMAYNDKVPDVGTFHYHMYDQYCDPAEFRPFYSRPRYMASHWNDEPHRLGLFDPDGSERPQYHMYRMLGALAPLRVTARADNEDIHIIASHDSNQVTLMMANYNPGQSSDTVMTISFKNGFNGRARLTVRRIDNDNIGAPALKTTEDRLTYLHGDFKFSVFVPADACVLITITRCR